MSAMQKFGRGAGGHMQRKPLNASNRAGAPLRRNNIGLKERTGVGGGRGIGGANNGGGNGGVVAPSATEETYQLLSPASGTPPPFAMMIRLTPEILEELKRVEEEGGKSVMKFGNNSSGHVIKVGNDEFKFSSVLEPGDLCDIYEEKQRGEDAQGLLVESGSVWRKLSVQRILSASEKDRVKKRSQEAEQKQKSRKAIILDHSGSLLSTQTASTTPATDANTRRFPVKTMKEPPLKKRKMESPVATIVKPKSQSTNPPSSSNRTSSPVPLSPDPSYVGMQGPSSSQAGGMPPPKALSTSEGRNTDSPSDKGNAAVQKDKISISALAAAVESGGYAKAGLAVNMTELRNLLIILLKENPKGMTIKAVEKALGEVIPNANPERKNIEKVIRLIATYQAPGKYLLNEGVDTGTLAKPPWSNGREQLKDRDMSEPCEPVRNTEIERIRNDGSAIDRLDEQKTVLVRQESIPQAANILPDPKKSGSSSAKCLGPVNTDGSDTSSSSESGSGSETDSESSGSGSGSDSGSGSGSDSDSEASSSSSSSEDNNMDEDVDIISEDENENRTDARQKHKPKDIKAALSKNDYKVQNKPQHDVQLGESKIINSGLNEMPAASNGSEDIDIADALEDGTIDKMTSELVKEVFGSEEDADMAVQDEVISFEGNQVSCEPKSGSAVDEKDGDACDKLIEADVGNRSVVGRKISSQMVQSSQDKGTAKSVHELDHNIGTEARDRKEIIKTCEGDAHTENELISAKNERRLSILGGKAASQHEKDELPFGSKGQAARKFGEKTSQRLESVDAKTRSIDATIHDVPSHRGLSESLESGKGQFSGSPLRGRDGIPQREKFGKEDLFSRQILESRKSSAIDVAETGKLVKNLESSYQQKRPTDSMLKDRPAIPQQLSRFGSNPEASGRLQQEEEILTKHTESMMKTFKDQELFGSKGKYGDTQSRERTHGSNNHASMRQTEIAGRPPKDMPQHSQQKDNGLFGPPSNVNAHSSYVNKDPDQSNYYERDVEHAKANKDSCKSMRSGGPGDEVKKSNSDRMGHVEKAERPPREPDCQTRAKESSSKSNSWRDSDPGGRMLNNGTKEVRNKNVESERLLLSGATNSSFEADRNIHDLELGELREQVHEDQAQPSRVMSLPGNKDYKSIQGFETSGRAVTKKDEGFNLVEKSQSAHRTGIDMRKPSPILSGNDLGNSLQESRNGKRRLDGNEISDLERPSSKRTLLQQHLSKHEMPASGASGRTATTDMLSPSPPDRQGHSRKSATKGVLETSCEQDFKERGHESSSKELSDNRGSISERQKFRIVHARESPKAEPLPNQTKKQTPTSSEVQGGDFFAPYEKKAPQLRGSIKSYEQYKEYCEEYHEKYLIYYRLHTVLESDKSDFELLRRDIEQAKSKGDKNKLASIYGKVRKDYLQCRKRFKRMRHTFLLLHEELQIMKQHCIEYAGKVGRR